jgi:hypothetical protein
MFDERNFCFVPKAAIAQEKELTLRIPGGGDSTASIGRSRVGTSETGQDHHEHHDEVSQTQRRTNTQGARQALLIVGHVFTTIGGKELQTLWHNRQVYAGVYAASLECLFARFAYTVFSPKIFRDFLMKTKEPRMLLVWDEDAEKYNIERTDPEKCKLTFRAAKARSESPTKRQRPAEDGNQDEDMWSEGFEESHGYCEDGLSDIDSGYHDGLCHSELGELGLDISSPDQQEPERGRERKHKHEESYDSASKAGDGYIGTKRVSRHAV